MKSKLLMVAIALMLLIVLGAGCGAATPQVIEKEVVRTVVVEKPIEIEKEVVRTVVVEKAVEVEKAVVQTVIVEKAVEVEKVVKETVVVEKEVIVEKEVPAKGPAVFAGAWPYPVPPTGHLNPPVTNSMILGIYRNLQYLPLGMYMWADGTWRPFLATEWGFKPPDLFEVKLREGVKWSDGSDFTSQDVLTSFNIARLMNHTVWRFLDRVEAVDDYTVNFYMSTPSTVVERYVIRGYGQPLILSTSLFGEWSDKLQALVDAGKDKDSDEWQALRQDFNGFRPDDTVVTGPYKLDTSSINEARLTLVKNELSYLADVVNFDTVYIYNGETPTVTPLILAHQVDYATHGFPPATEMAYKAEGIRILRPPIFSGPALYFNHTIYPFDVKEVRQAIAHAINRDENATVSLGESAIAQKWMVGFSDNVVPLWLSKAELDQLDLYEYDLDKAEAMFKELGFTKGSDGVWVTDKGDRMEYELTAPAEYADWSAAAENVAEQLTNFGIKTAFRGVQFQQHPIDVNKGEFQLAIRGWGSGNPHPHFSYVQDLFTHNIEAAEGPGMSYPLVQTTDAVGEIDLEEEVVTSVEGLDEAAQKSKIARVALAYNELLPQIPIWERYGNNPVLDGLHTTGWLPEGDPIYLNSPYVDSFVILMILDGTLKPL